MTDERFTSTSKLVVTRTALVDAELDPSKDSNQSGKGISPIPSLFHRLDKHDLQIIIIQLSLLAFFDPDPILQLLFSINRPIIQTSTCPLYFKRPTTNLRRAQVNNPTPRRLSPPLSDLHAVSGVVEPQGKPCNRGHSSTVLVDFSPTGFCYFHVRQRLRFRMQLTKSLDSWTTSWAPCVPSTLPRVSQVEDSIRNFRCRTSSFA